MDAAEERDRHRTADRAVRPRGVWAGVALAVVGASLAGLGVALGSWVISLVGVAVLLAGAVVGARSGVLYDVRGVDSVSDELSDIRHDATYSGVAPGDMSDQESAQETSRRMDRRRENILAERAGAPRPALAPLAGGTLVLVGVVLLVAQGTLYPSGATGQSNAGRALAVAIVAAATGLRYLVATGRHWGFAAAALAAGAALTVSGVLTGHTRDATVGLEITCGLVVVASAVIGVLSPRRR
ncbi:MAG: hypothetical protein WB471_09825 [Nocardioides sp.]